MELWSIANVGVYVQNVMPVKSVLASRINKLAVQAG